LAGGEVRALDGRQIFASCEENERRGGYGHRETVNGNIHLDGFVLVVWRLLSMLIFGQVAGQARWRRRSSKTPPLGFSSHPKSASARPRPHFTSSTYTATISSPFARSNTLGGMKNTACTTSTATRTHDIVATRPNSYTKSEHTIYPSSTSPPHASDISSRGWSVAPGSKSHTMKKIGEDEYTLVRQATRIGRQSPQRSDFRTADVVRGGLVSLCASVLAHYFSLSTIIRCCPGPIEADI
jgi:hypothetical protein